MKNLRTMRMTDGQSLEFSNTNNASIGSIRQDGTALRLTGPGTGVAIGNGHNLTFQGATASIGGINSILTIGNAGDAVGLNKAGATYLIPEISGNLNVSGSITASNFGAAGAGGAAFTGQTTFSDMITLRGQGSSGATGMTNDIALNIEHTGVNGSSSIYFKSNNSVNSDYAYIRFQDTTGAAGTEFARLTIGVENDGVSAGPDQLMLSAYTIVNAAYTGGSNSVDIISFQHNSAEKAKIDKDGNLKATSYLIGTTAVIESDAKINYNKLKGLPTTLAGYGITNGFATTGGTLTGDVIINKVNPSITLTDSDLIGGTYPSIHFDNANKQGITLFLNEIDVEIPDVEGYGLIIRKKADNTGVQKALLSVEGNIYANTDKLVWHTGNFDPTTLYTKTNLQTTGQSQVHWGNLTNKPTSFPANGGDADTVGGLAPSSFMRSDMNTKTTGKLYVQQTTNITDALISLAIGDNDTGFNWVSDGVLNFVTDSVVTAEFKKAGRMNFKVQPTVNDSNIWHAGNFDPATKFNTAGGTVSGATTFGSAVTMNTTLDVKGNKISMNKFSMEYNTTDDSVDFVFV